MNYPASPAPETRFSDRVENYIRHRPGYPPGVLLRLVETTGLTPDSHVADIGSGTGISTRFFLEHGCRVSAVEPNPEMRAAAERLLASFPRFTSVDGKAQATTLPDHDVDLVIAAQAFHWFATPATRAEFTRILKPGGHIALLWNERELDTTPFLRDYEQLLLTYGTDYARVRHENTGQEHLDEFFSGPFTLHTFTNRQTFAFDALKGRLLSSSYTPAEGHPAHEEMIARLHDIHSRHQINGVAEIDYTTRLYIGC